jgi:aminopeptidase N
VAGAPVCRCKLRCTLFSAEMRIRLPFFAALFFIIVRPEMNAEKPFNFQDTPGKLPKEVVPIEYSVRIVPSIDKFTFTGTETVKLSVRRPVRQLVLNALELQVADASIDGKALPDSAIKIDKKSELLTLALPSELAAGEHTLALSFTGQINQQGQGLFYVPYQEHGSGAKKNHARNAV